MEFHLRDYVLAWNHDHPPHENDLENLTLRNKLLYEKEKESNCIRHISINSTQLDWIINNKVFTYSVNSSYFVYNLVQLIWIDNL
jgi:hypothetical protein